MRVGIDLVEVKRFERVEHINYFFTQNEIDYIESKGINKMQTMAGIFSAKEAFVKAIKCGLGNGSILKNIEILHESNGSPFVCQNDLVINLLNDRGLKNIEISISHTKEFAEAICIIF